MIINRDSGSWVVKARIFWDGTELTDIAKEIDTDTGTVECLAALPSTHPSLTRWLIEHGIGPVTFKLQGDILILKDGEEIPEEYSNRWELTNGNPNLIKKRADRGLPTFEEIEERANAYMLTQPEEEDISV